MRSGYELLFQPEVVRVYTMLLRETKNPSVLEAAAGAIQNLCAGRWTVSAIFSKFIGDVTISRITFFLFLFFPSVWAVYTSHNAPGERSSHDGRAFGSW